MSDFFVTLMSNSSETMFPQNTTASFTVLLPEKITLSGSWHVALAEVHFNYNFFNITRGNNRLFLMEKSHNSDTNEIQASNEIVSHEITLADGFYGSVGDLVATINESMANHVKKMDISSR